MPPLHSDVDKAIVQAQEDVARMEEHLRSLKTYKNTLTCVGRLPDETLLYIISIVKDLCRPLNSWIHLTHVCSRWRAVALRYPLLWTNIDCWTGPRREACLLTFLERSAKSPIELRTHCGPYCNIWKAVFLENLHRWRRLVKFYITNDVVQALQQHSVQPVALPALQSADFTFHLWYSDLGAATYYLDLDLPRLTTLRCSMSLWPAMQTWLKPGLVHLTVYAIGPPYSYQASVSEWIAVLQLMPSLESLDLSNVFEDMDLEDGAFDHPASERIYLPRLRRACVRVAGDEALNAATYLVHHLEAWPSSIDITMNGHPSGMTEEASQYAPILRSYKRFFTTAVRQASSAFERQQPTETVDAWIEWDWDTFQVILHPSKSDSVDALLLASVDLPNERQLRPVVADLAAHILATCPAYCAVASLRLDCCPSPGAWAHLTAARLRSLDIPRAAFAAFLQALEDAHAVFMPQLAVLTVSSFPEDARLPPPRLDQKVGRVRRPLLQRLADVVLRREKLGMGPRVVHLHGGIHGPRDDVGTASGAAEVDDDDDYGLSLLFG